MEHHECGCESRGGITYIKMVGMCHSADQNWTRKSRSMTEKTRYKNLEILDVEYLLNSVRS